LSTKIDAKKVQGELKALSNPPRDVLTVLQIWHFLLDFGPANCSWKDILKSMATAQYRDRLQNYKPQNSHAKKILKWVQTNPELTAEVIAKKCSPLTGLVHKLWCLDEFFKAEG